MTEPLRQQFSIGLLPRNDPECERTELSEKVERRELYLQGGWLIYIGVVKIGSAWRVKFGSAKTLFEPSPNANCKASELNTYYFGSSLFSVGSWVSLYTNSY
jgi:hypothetical protein